MPWPCSNRDEVISSWLSAGQLQTERDFNVELEDLSLHVQPLRPGTETHGKTMENSMGKMVISPGKPGFPIMISDDYIDGY